MLNLVNKGPAASEQTYPAHPTGTIEKRVVITGASGGLGRILAARFDEKGARLGLAARNQDKLASLAESLQSPALLFLGDIRTEAFNDKIAQDMLEHYGGIDVWICNAGISPIVAGVCAMSLKDWTRIIETNLTGVFLGARAAARVMKPGGRIIVSGSVLGDRGMPGLSAYSASKGGVSTLVKSLAQEFGPKGITVNSVTLGWFDEGLGESWQRHSDNTESIAEQTVLGRWGTPEDLPEAFLFLASPGASYVTGASIVVDGGYSLL